MKKLLYIALAIALGVSACTERIDLELNDDNNQRLVVDGWFTDQEKVHTVRLTKTTSYFHNEAAPMATGATVKITDGVETFHLTETSPGVYETADNVAGKRGQTYTLEIDLDGEHYEASSYMDTIPPIDSITYELYEELEGEPEDIYDLFLWAQEPAGVGDYYYLKTYLNGNSMSDTLRNNAFASDELVDGGYIKGAYFNEVLAESGDSLRIEMHAISSESYRFFEAVMLETDWRGGIFDGPPANIPSNVNNGALGFFVTSAVSEESLVLIK